MLEKTVNLTRFDLIKYNLFVLPRMPSHLRTLVSIWITVILVNWTANRSDPSFAFEWSFFARTFLVALVAFLVWYSAILLYSIGGSHGDDMTGETTYFIEEEGFRYVTDSTNSLTPWEKISEIGIVGNTIYVVLAGFVFRLMPRHQFDTDEDFSEFHRLLEERVAASSSDV